MVMTWDSMSIFHVYRVEFGGVKCARNRARKGGRRKLTSTDLMRTTATVVDGGVVFLMLARNEVVFA
jgi:hypothetical protein